MTSKEVLSQEQKEKVENLTQVTIEALKRVYYSVQRLGEEGKKETGERNEFGHTTFKADIEAGRAFLSFLRERGVSAIVVSEEYGAEVRIGDDPKYLGVLDELDGSTAYKNGLGRYGTMFAIFEGLDPNYDDYIVSGILEHTTGKIYFATKNQGAFVLDIATNEKTPIRSSGRTKLDPNETRVAIDGGWIQFNEVFVRNLSDFDKQNVFVGTDDNGGASCAYYTDLSKGDRDIVGECTRKRNLEIAAAFGLLTEAGVVVVDLNGENLGQKKFLSFGQGEGEHLPFISAASAKLAQSFVDRIKFEQTGGLEN